MCSTKMVRSTFVFAPHRTRYGAENIARLVTDPGLRSTSGAYFNERRRIEPNAFAHDPAGRRRLWDVALAQSRVADHADTVLPELLTV
jgi:hypothetical protein